MADGRLTTVTWHKMTSDTRHKYHPSIRIWFHLPPRTPIRNEVMESSYMEVQFHFSTNNTKTDSGPSTVVSAANAKFCKSLPSSTTTAATKTTEANKVNLSIVLSHALNSSKENDYILCDQDDDDESDGLSTDSEKLKVRQSYSEIFIYLLLFFLLTYCYISRLVTATLYRVEIWERRKPAIKHYLPTKDEYSINRTKFVIRPPTQTHRHSHQRLLPVAYILPGIYIFHQP